MNNDLYQTTTDRILDMLDKGTVPWRHPIVGAPGCGSGGGMPRNLQSGKAYRGVNVFLLAVAGWVLGYDSPHWLTFRQARERGGHVRKGEKSTPIIFWKQHHVEDRETGKQKPVPVLRCYHVFNAQQCEDLRLPEEGQPGQEPEPFEPLDEAERIVTSYNAPPAIERGGMAAFYRADTDIVRMPPSARFVDREAYYATLFHELAHSTGHPRRLNREAFRVAPGREPGSVRPDRALRLGRVLQGRTHRRDGSRLPRRRPQASARPRSSSPPPTSTVGVRSSRVTRSSSSKRRD